MTERSLVKKPRPVVFSLAELERYPTLEDRYAITLPFRDSAGHCYCDWYTDDCADCELRYSEVEAKCIKRTGERWAWFSAARDLDDERGERLGTLGYLPWEIRQEIIKALLSDDQDYSHQQTIHTMFMGRRIYPLMFAGPGSRSYGIRLASPSTKAEFEHYYFTKTNFLFYQVEHLEAFLDKLSIHQQTLLRSFTLTTLRCYSNASMWIAVCARLPPNLMSVDFKLRAWSDGVTVTWADGAMGAGGAWFIRNASWYRSQRAINILEVLGNRARRHAARAKIGLGRSYGDEYVDPSGEGWIRVLHDVEPWSEDWLKWWEEDGKVDLDDGKRAIKVA